MGYYSEVAICMAFEDDEKRDAFWEVVRLRKDEMAKQLENHCAKDDRMPWITFHHESIKWYDIFPEIQAYDDLMKLCLECGGAYRFMRLGENDDDIETRDEASEDDKVEIPWDAFCMERHISWG